MSDQIEPTKEEQRAINSLKRLAKRWPRSLWLYSANGTLHVMKKKGDKRAMLPLRGLSVGGGGVDPDFSIETIEISNDGGDW